MNSQYKQYAAKFDALSIRERSLIVVTALVIMVYLWWFLYAEVTLAKSKDLEQQNVTLENEIKTLNITATTIEQRIQQGVHKSEQQQLALLNSELDRVNNLLKQKTLTLIDPDDMFELMQELIFNESKLKLTGLKRKQVKPAFESNSDEEQQAEVYRHVMQVNFQGSYQDTLNYVSRLEKLDWKLIWDSITLTSDEYPLINVEIEISTLSDSQNWVGL